LLVFDEVVVEDYVVWGHFPGTLTPLEITIRQLNSRRIRVASIMSTPRATISISSTTKDHVRAASVLSQHLSARGYAHAFIGGFAWTCLGSRRPTLDIDVLIQTNDGINLKELQNEISEADAHFASAGIKYYFIKEPQTGVPSNQLLFTNENNVVIETLPTGALGLPTAAEPVYEAQHDGHSFRILHPSILILTKIKRWVVISTSTRPETKIKARSDQRDIEYLLEWLAAKSLFIDLDAYQGKSRPQLFVMLKTFKHRSLHVRGSEDVLKCVMREADWKEMEALEVSVD